MLGPELYGALFAGLAVAVLPGLPRRARATKGGVQDALETVVRASYERHEARGSRGAIDKAAEPLPVASLLEADRCVFDRQIAHQGPVQRAAEALKGLRQLERPNGHGTLRHL